MSRTAQIIWQAAGVSIVASLLIAAVVWAGQTEPNLRCSSIVYIYEDGNKRMYVSENELNRLLTEVKHAENNVMELIRKPEKLIEPSLSLKEQNKKREIINGNLNYVKDLLFKCRCRLEVKLRLVEMKENRQKQSSGQST